MLSDPTFNGIYDIVSSVFDAPERQLVMWIEQNTKYFADFDQWYKGLSSSDNVRLDTKDREHVFDVIAMYFLKVQWPNYGAGSQAYKQFMDKLDRAIVQYEWKLKRDQTVNT